MGRNDRIERAVAALLLLILAVACFVVLRPFLSALLWAAILSSSTWPVYVALERLLGGRRTAAAAVMIACAAVILLLPLALVLSHLAGEATELATAASRWMEVGPPEPPAWVATLPLVGPRLHAYWASVAQNGARLVADLRAYVGPAREWIVATGLSLGAGLAELVLALLVAFFFYRDGMAGMRALRSALGRVAGAQGARLLVIAGATIKSVVYGVLGTNLVQGVLAGLGLWAVGIPSPLLLGFALFFLCLVPLAPMLVFAPAIVWLIQQGAVGSAVFLGVWYVVVFIIVEGVLRAYLISRGGLLPLLLVFLGIIGGIAAFGLLGIFLGPTLLALGYALVLEWNAERETSEPATG